MPDQLSFQQRIQERVKQITTAASDELWSYREAAAVLASFDYESLQPLGDVPPSSTAKTELLADCDIVYLPNDSINWTLRTSIRRAALHRLLSENRITAALNSNPERPASPEQRVLERFLSGITSIGAIVRSPDERKALLGVIDWLSGVPEFEGKLPNTEVVKQRIAREQLFEPFQDLVGNSFAGRRTELKRLADYVGVHDAYSRLESFKRFFSIHERPPLFINGPGGCGKSTLVAKFILDHTLIEETSRFPFAYLDFDRVGLVAEEPITLLADVMRQLAIQFPEMSDSHRKLANEWSSHFSQRLTSLDQVGFGGDSPKRIRKEEREHFLVQFADFVNNLKSRDAPLLLVLDTFEEVQFRSAAFADEVLDFLNDLQARVPKLRSVLSGRNDIESTEYEVDVVAIGNFDREAAVSYLGARGLPDSEIAGKIFDQVGGSPLVLRLAADVARLEEVDATGIGGLSSSWLSLFAKQSIEVVLYKRILHHVKDKRVAQLAYPGLILRQVTAPILQEVLGPACKVEIASADDAKQLVKVIRNQLSTILVPSSEDREILIHRPDMRAILLRDVNERALKDSAFGKKLKKIHDEAIKFYGKFNDPANRAEEIYHRLSLGVEREILASRWMDGLRPFLGSSIRELPSQSQIYLAARLEFELPEEYWTEANDEDWALYASRKTNQQLDLQKPFDALKMLEQRKHLWRTDLLQPAFNKVTDALFHAYATEYEQIRATNSPGNARTRMMNSLVSSIGATAKVIAPNPDYAGVLFSEGGVGLRLVAIAVANASPAATHMDIAIAAIRNSLSPFEQFHALRLARIAFEQSTELQRGALRKVLQVQEGTPIHESDLSRVLIRNELLSWLGKVPVFSLDVLRARKGDCLILHYGSFEDPGLVMIDGGPKGVYSPHLRPRLEKIKEARGLDENEPLVVDLLLVSHVDDDHIQGILDLTKELIAAQMDMQPQFVQILSVWHNSFEDILDDNPKVLTAALASQFGPSSMEGDPPDLSIEADGEDEEVIRSSLRVLASIRQSAQLRSDMLNRLQTDLNRDFDGGLITANQKRIPIEMEKGLRFTVVGPTVPELKKLQQRHQAWLKGLKKERKSAEDLLSTFIDKSVPSLSSIVVLAELGKKRMLLTGDARGDMILAGLEDAGLMEKSGKMHVDLLKVPHHGSFNNLVYEFFERITADHYVFSGNGEYGNPERESLETLMNARGDEDYTIHLTYPIEEIDLKRKKNWDKEQSKERKKREKNRATTVRPDWSREAHTLEALIDKHPHFAKKISIVKDDQPHVIDLLDEVGF